MREYNDYISTTRRYLQNYRTFLVTIENLQDDIAAQQQLLDSCADMPPAIGSYDSPRGGIPELNTVERSASDRMKRQNAIVKLTGDLNELRRIVRKIDRSLAALTGEEETLIRAHYFDGRSWAEIGEANHYSEKWARDKGGKALRSIATMIFGVRVMPEQTHFVFID